MKLKEIVSLAKTCQATDVFLIAGEPISFKQKQSILFEEGPSLTEENTQALIQEAYCQRGRSQQRYQETGDDDFSLDLEGLRLRINAYRQRGSCAAVIRLVSEKIPHPDALGIPPLVMEIAEFKKGLVLVTGPAGSGKSTTLACLVQRINQTQAQHIITIEDPVEYLYPPGRSLISQREVGTDTNAYAVALRASLRQAPDTILVGEMRDYETIRTALTAAETGHLVLSTLHTLGAGNTVNRIIDIFPPEQQQQVRVQLATELACVVTQQLLPTLSGEITPVFEVVKLNTALRNMIRENKTHQMGTSISLSSGEGFLSMDRQIMTLWKTGQISREVALSHALRPDTFRERIEVGEEIPALPVHGRWRR